MPVAYNPAASTKDRKVRVIAMRTTLAECIHRLTPPLPPRYHTVSHSRLWLGQEIDVEDISSFNTFLTTRINILSLSLSLSLFPSFSLAPSAC